MLNGFFARRRRSARRYVFAFCALVLSAAIAAVLAEIALRVFWRHTPLAVIQRYDPEFGWSNREGVSGTYESGNGGHPFAFDDNGFRVAPSTDVAADDSVLVLGDSYAAGLEVGPADTFAAVLQQQLARARGNRPVRVVNTGVRGWGTDQEYLLARRWCPRLRPRLVIAQACRNDPTEILTEVLIKGRFRKPRFIFDQSGALTLVGSPAPEIPTPLWTACQWNSALFQLLVNRSTIFRWIAERLSTVPPPRDGPVVSQPSRLFASLVQAIGQTATDSGAAFLLVFIDDPRTYRAFQPDWSEPERDWGSAVVRRLEDDRVSWMVFTPSTAQTIPGDGHLNEAGHRALAEALFQEIERRALIAP